MPKDLSVSALLDFYGPFTEKQRELFDLYYNEDLSLSEIAEHAGITRQGVRDLIKRGELQLKKFEKECGLCQNIMSLRSLLDSDKPDAEKLKAAKELLNKF